MYRQHFALSAFPFDVTPQPDALFASAALREAEARLTHLLESEPEEEEAEEKPKEKE